MVEVMKIMVTSFKRFHACTATLHTPNPAAGHHRPTPPLETPRHSQASLGQSLMGSLLLSPGEGNGTPLQYSCLENPMDGGAWWAAFHGVTKSRTRLSDFTLTFHFLALEKEMATHSSVLAWRIPGTGEPGGLPSMGSHSVGHDWSDLAAPFSWVLGHKVLFVPSKSLFPSSV